MLKKMDEVEITNGNNFPQNPTISASNNPPTLKRKRNLPGNPGMLIFFFFFSSLYNSLHLLIISIGIFKGNLLFIFYLICVQILKQKL
jgi:hypothetical protein